MADEYTTSAISPMRKVIAARMVEAKRAIPHFRVGAEIQIDQLLKLRDELRLKGEGVAVSLTDLLIKACAGALMDTPAANIQWVDGEVRQYLSADVAVVTAVTGGLSTPVIRHAESKTVWDISRELKRLVERAARNALRIDEIVGGTFTISNLGMYGVDQFDAIINPPQCMILALGVAKPRCVVSAERDIRVATVMNATLSVDHRALDGVMAAKFLSALRDRVERPEYASFTCGC